LLILVTVPLDHHRVGTGEPLVLIHGIGSRWQVWDRVFPLLAPSREVIAIDLPGFGASGPPPPGTPPGVEPLTGLVAQFLDELGLERPHVAGNSLGGWIALALAQQGRASSATALSPAGFWNRREAAFARVSLRVTVRAARLASAQADRLLAVPGARRLAFSQLVARPTRIPPEEAAATIRALGGAWWFDQTLDAITAERFAGGPTVGAPVTIAWGQRDRLLLPRQAARAARQIPSAQIVTLTGCGHVPTYDDPEQVARVLLAGSSPVHRPGGR
jgi:pimeloyl-ACP methyl ester carboxylesterase